MSYKEIYNIHAYFAGPSKGMLKALNESYPELVASYAPSPPSDTSDSTSTAPSGKLSKRGVNALNGGDEALRRIAKAGRKWKNTLARKVDMEGE